MQITTYPADVLRKKATPFEGFGTPARQLFEEMLETMYSNNGVGLAAPQVSKSLRLFIFDISPKQNDPQLFINPRIIRAYGKSPSTEGCLSLPELEAKVTRADKITVQAMDLEGKQFEVDAEGLLAIVIQHELDHLEGMLLVDRMSRLQKIRARKKLDYLKGLK